jgi:hypothetical protein
MSGDGADGAPARAVVHVHVPLLSVVDVFSVFEDTLWKMYKFF